MGYIASWVRQIEISSVGLARALFRVFIRSFTTVVINFKFGNNCIVMTLAERYFELPNKC